MVLCKRIRHWSCGEKPEKFNESDSKKTTRNYMNFKIRFRDLCGSRTGDTKKDGDNDLMVISNEMWPFDHNMNWN